ncbi:MAG: inositol monophosphatase family protein [Balneolaceae bacterium]
MKNDLNELRKSAALIARSGGDSTLKYFKKSFNLEFKDDESPVTNADKQAEIVIREAIRKKYPSHGIIGEEFGIENQNSDIVWIIDPIDGTQSFIHGVPFYTTLIGIMVDGVPSVGIIYAPALNEMVSAATGGGVTLNEKECRARPCDDIRKATFLTTDFENIEKFGFQRPFRKLLHATRVHRTWGDAYGHLMVATGRADIMFDPILKIWDAAALLPVVTEAGGSYTDVHGKKTIETGNAISCTKGLAEDVIKIFSE